jgi:ATP-dependent Clp protease ATP-binding subunit ClpA
MSVFAHYTEGARQVIVKAQQEAHEQQHDYIGSEHIFLGLLRESEKIGAIALNSLGVGLEQARARVIGIVPEGNGQLSLSRRLPQMLTPHANKVCELALRESMALGQSYVGTEHELLALVRDSRASDYPRKETGITKGTPENRIFPDDERSIVGEVLTSLDISLDEVRETTFNLLGARR